MNDLRNPRELGTRLLELAAETPGAPLSSVYDRFDLALELSPDYRDPANALERYGDPVKKHQARIALGMEVELP